jgi:quercetin dioxygenase-like cupin family protein
MITTTPADREARPAPAEWFSGDVRMAWLHAAEAPGRASALTVRFAPGARTNWHTHPLGQLLIVTEGTCLVQAWEGDIRRLSPGDTAWFAPGEKHWHGASDDAPMTHIALHEALDGRSVDWMEPVT